MKEFYHFGGAVEIDDSTINLWIRDGLEKVKSGSTHHCVSSGDTSVIVLVWDTEIEVIVANNRGRSKLRFSTVEGFEDKLTFFPYSRPL